MNFPPAYDCSPLQPQPLPKQAEWLKELAKKVRAENHVLSFGGSRDDDEPVVYCERDGTWWAGRYVGAINFEGGQLVIRPRFGMDVLAGWLSQVANVLLIDSPGRLRDDVSFVAQLVAVVWARGFVEAARHGLPALRQDRWHVGSIVRGRLDVLGTLEERAACRQAVVSVRRERTLDNPVAKILAAAYAVLRRWMGPGKEGVWLPEQARDLMPRLLSVTGTNPAAPSDSELLRVRYTPITQGFAAVVRLSQQIIRHRGLLSDAAAEGEVKGVLLDVAELWELFVVSVAKEAAGHLDVTHGTSEEYASGVLLTSEKDGSPLGMLRPDVVLRSRNSVAGVIDAKYKSLWPSVFSPYGTQREDLYQLVSYLSAMGRNHDTWGILAYPKDPQKAGTPPVEERNPWRLETAHRVWFVSLPHEAKTAISALRQVILFTVS